MRSDSEFAASQGLWRLGIDIGGTAVKIALVNESGKTWHESSNSTPSHEGLEAFLGDLVQAVGDALNAARHRGIEVEDIGIGVPGLVENNRIIGGINNIPILNGVSLDEELGRYFELPVRVENDAYYMGVAESRFGAARGARNVVFITVGAGIGGALMIDSRFYRGTKNRACEFGHIVLSHGGEPCTCGNNGCFEALASMSALVRRYNAKAGDKPLQGSAVQAGPDIVSRYRRGEAAAVDAFDWHFTYLACGIGSLINIFNPDKVVVGGGITESGPFYVRELKRRVMENVMADTFVGTSIDLAELGNRAGCIGAACDGSEVDAAQLGESLDKKVV